MKMRFGLDPNPPHLSRAVLYSDGCIDDILKLGFCVMSELRLSILTAVLALFISSKTNER